MYFKKSLLTTSLAIILGYSTASAKCFLDQANTGWTGSVTFHCDSDTNLVTNPISFDLSNGATVSSIWGLPGDVQYPKNNNKITATVKQWWPDEPYVLPAHQSATLKFSPSTDNFQISNFHVGSVTPASTATITVILPEKPANLDADIKPQLVIYQGTQKVAEIDDQNWGTSYNHTVSFSGDSADFSIQVDNISVDTGIDTGVAAPATFNLTNGQTQSVKVSYQLPVPVKKGNLAVDLQIKSATALSESPNYTIKDSQGQIIKQGALTLGNNQINDLIASDEGAQYTLTSTSFVSGDTKYTPEQSNYSFIIKPNQTTPLNVIYDAQAIAKETIHLNVKGLPDAANSTIQLTDGEQSQSVQVSGNKAYDIDIPQNGKNWQISASSYNHYIANIMPNSFIANTAENNVAVNYQQQLEKKSISGYWENWKGALKAPAGTQNSDPAYYSQDVKPYTHVFYAFLTLDKTPNPDNPANKYWDGSAIYESMTTDNVLTLMQKYPDGTPDWARVDNWQRSKIDALIQAVHQNNAKFIWAIGGWSDLQKTLRSDQVDAFVTQVVDLLKLSGDGVDFDWEHLSANTDIRTEQLNTMAEMLLKLHQALAAAGMQDKEVIFTPRFNTFMQNASQYGFAQFASDGEGLVIDQWLKAHDSSLSQVINRSNVMAYDVALTQMPHGQTWSLPVYQNIYNTFSQHLNKNQIVMGFEPGGQAAGGVWEGLDTDKSVIDTVQSMGYGGSMFWAINQPQYNSSEVTGLNADELATYSQTTFDPNQP